MTSKLYVKTVNLSRELHLLLEARAKDDMLPQAQVIRFALREYLKKEGKQC